MTETIEKRPTSPLLPNDMRRTVRSPRHILVDRPMASSVYADLVVDNDFWNGVSRRYDAAMAERRPTPTLVKANIASHVAMSETPEAQVLSRFADATGTVPAANMVAALAVLGADCSDRVAQHLVAHCAGSSGSGLSEAQFLTLADAIRGTASQSVIATRLRCRTPDRDAAVRASIAQQNAAVTGFVDVELTSRSSSVVGTTRRGRSPSIGGRASSAAYRRLSPARTTGSVASARSGTHTLKSLASLQLQQARRAAQEMDAVTSPKSPRAGTSGAYTPRTPASSERRRPAVPEPSLDTISRKDLEAMRERRHVAGRNALITKQPKLTTNRFDVATLKF
jgi:hypothetical protein